MYYTFRIAGNEGASHFVNYDENIWCEFPADALKHVKTLQMRYKEFPGITNVKITYRESEM